MMYPYYIEIPYQEPLPLFHYFSLQEGSVFLDSAQSMEECGRYSFIAVAPFHVQNSKDSTIDPLNILQHEIKKFPLHTHPDLPPFQGGVAGFFSYDLGRHLERLPSPADDMQFPDLVLGYYDLVLAFDHLVKRAWIFSSGYPELNSPAREIRAKQRCEWLLSILEETQPLPALTAIVCDKARIESNFSQREYENAVKRIIDYILAGDIFEANISQRFKTTLPKGLDPFDLYRRLRLINAAPFAAFLNFGDTVIASASPERFLKLTSGQVETRPIKGTRTRGQNPKQDGELAKELLTSSKDRAENIMIVDLLRNDLSRVCKDHSVNVPQLCQLESYATVHHLVSVVRGTLKKDHDAIDLLRATFPGGSITGAPKIRSMEIITEIEKLQRGPYCGSIGYIGFNGDMDCSITIRSYAIKNNTVTFQAGGAIVADSDPESEYMETLAKARALHAALVDVPIETY